MDKYIGKKLDGRYEIKELIGVGGMANVYKAYDSIEERTVAVKILRDEFLTNEEFLRRFKNESKAISVLSHQNIVKIHDVSFSDKVHSIVMEYIDGITLKEYIEQQKVLNWKETVHFTIQILRALQHAHDKGIIHRDIKPQNIMLLQDGMIKVTDFGIARFTRSETRTITDKAIGSVHYISPEQAYGKPVDGRSDIYSVGIMLYEMLTGRLPFEADSPVSVALQQIQVNAIKPREVNKDIPIGLEQITLKAMEKDIDRRFHSAAEMLRYLEEFKKNTDVTFDSLTVGTAADTPRTGHKTREKARHEKVARRPKKKVVTSPTKSPAMSIISGVATGFIISAFLFIVAMFVVANPFATVETIKTPNFDKMTLADAQALYPDLTFFIEEETFYPGYNEGEIYYQKPAADKSIKANTTINVKVSLGTQVMRIPDLYGEDATIAVNMLKSYGFKVSEIRDFSNTVAENLVIKTVPAKLQEAAIGSTVQVYISMGSNQLPITVPDITGKTIQEATEILNANGLEIGTITPVQSSRPVGTIIVQSPMESSSVAPGTLIDVNVSSGNGTTFQNTIQLPITLPTALTTTVTMEGILDGVVKQSETLIPSDVVTWYPVFEGAGASRVKIMINGDLYQEYLLDFTTGYYMLDIDNSSSFKTQD